VKLPNTGGDTQFVNMAEAYDALSVATKKRIDGLQARHVYQSRFSERKLPKLPGERSTIATKSVVHPLVRTHPQSGRKAIYINPIRIEEIIGMNEAQALPLLDELLEHATQAKFQYRHKWKSGDVVIWDNRCLLHKANGDYPVEQVRYLYRLMLKGERPV
jgi:taurine dioxygenase